MTSTYFELKNDELHISWVYMELPPVALHEMFDYSLSEFQLQAISAIQQNRSVLVTAHTGNGKTTVAEAAIEWALRSGGSAIFTSPIKALSNQKFLDWNQRYKHWQVGLMTGDLRVNLSSRVLICTTEILRNWLLGDGGPTIGNQLRVVVFDEVHWMADPARGEVWEESIIALSQKRDPRIVLVMLSATVSNAPELANWVSRLQDSPCEICQTDVRVVPLKWEKFSGGELVDLADGKLEDRKCVLRSILDKLSLENRLPCIWFKISKHGCERLAAQYEGSLLSASEQHLVVKRWRELVDPVYRELHTANQIERLLSCGVAYHHSGMIPNLKESIEVLFGEGLIKVLFATETLAMGINMPARSVVLSSMTKPGEFPGSWRDFTYSEIIQMAGRAGRRGKDKIGYVIWAGGLLNHDRQTKFNGRDLAVWLEREKPLSLVSQRKMDKIDVLLQLFGDGHTSINDIVQRSVKCGFQDLWGTRIDGLHQQSKVYSQEMLSWFAGDESLMLLWLEEREQWYNQIKVLTTRKARERIEQSKPYRKWQSSVNKRVHWLALQMEHQQMMEHETISELEIHLGQAVQILLFEQLLESEATGVIEKTNLFRLTKWGKALTMAADFNCIIWGRLLRSDEIKNSLLDWADWCGCVAYYLGWDVDWNEYVEFFNQHSQREDEDEETGVSLPIPSNAIRNMQQIILDCAGLGWGLIQFTSREESRIWLSWLVTQWARQVELSTILPEAFWGPFIRVMIRLVGVLESFVNMIRSLEGTSGGWELMASQCDGAIVKLIRGPVMVSFKPC